MFILLIVSHFLVQNNNQLTRVSTTAGLSVFNPDPHSAKNIQIPTFLDQTHKKWPHFNSPQFNTLFLGTKEGGPNRMQPRKMRDTHYKQPPDATFRFFHLLLIYNFVTIIAVSGSQVKKGRNNCG
jgi:hypothetical protein